MSGSERLTSAAIDQYVARARAARQAQGLPAGVEHQATLDKLAVVMSKKPARAARKTA